MIFHRLRIKTFLTKYYFTNNQKRLDYALFRQQGYFIGRGTVESSCKQVVTMRLKAPGAR